MIRHYASTVLLFCFAVIACGPAKPPPCPAGKTTVEIVNTTSSDAVVYFAFGSDSVVLPSSLPFCSGSGLNCTFPLAKHSTQPIPTQGQYLNVTVSFNAAVTCGVTKAELNVNNPKWYNTLDISLVDGFSSEVLIESTEPSGKRTPLGPVWTADHNEKVFGVFPLGCDICVARQNPPCKMKPGNDGCKTGTQYNPDVPCQFQAATMGGGGAVRVSLLEGQPAAQ